MERVNLFVMITFTGLIGAQLEAGPRIGNECANEGLCKKLVFIALLARIMGGRCCPITLTSQTESHHSIWFLEKVACPRSRRGEIMSDDAIRLSRARNLGG